jgi:hypothetical protein
MNFEKDTIDRLEILNNTINSKLEQIGNNQELSLIVKNLYKRITIFSI